MDKVKKHYSRLPIPGGGTSRKGDRFDVRPGMNDPQKRIEDMDLEGIDVALTFPGGAGEEWAMLDPEFAEALCQALNNSKAAFDRQTGGRTFGIAKVPMIDPERAARELRRAVKELGLKGMATTQHVREKNLDHPSFDVVWKTAEELGVAARRPAAALQELHAEVVGVAGGVAHGVLDQHGNAAERRLGRSLRGRGAGLVEQRVDHRVELGVHALDPRDGGLDQLRRTDLAAAHQLGLGSGVEEGQGIGHRGSVGEGGGSASPARRLLR